MEYMLKLYPHQRGRATLIQIMNPTRGKEIDYDEILDKVRDICKRINKEFEQPGYTPIILLETPVSITQKFTFYTMADGLVVTLLRDGTNLSPYEYIACRQRTCSSSHKPKESMLVISEFIGCSLSLSGALHVNPWNIEAVAMEMHAAISKDESIKQSRHTKHYSCISNHDVVHWSASFFKDMERTSVNQFRRRCQGVGFGLDFRVVSLDPGFSKLPLGTMISDYRKAKTRVILLDYDGTLIPLDSGEKFPGELIISTLNDICVDKRNVVFIISGRGRDSLSEWFESCKDLGIAAEHGFFLRCDLISFLSLYLFDSLII